MIERDGDQKEYTVKPTEIKNKYTGMYLDEKCKVVTIDKNSPAEKQGIQANDKIIKINNEEINGNVKKAVNIIQEKDQRTIILTIQRGKENKNIEK